MALDCQHYQAHSSPVPLSLTPIYCCQLSQVMKLSTVQCVPRASTYFSMLSHSSSTYWPLWDTLLCALTCHRTVEGAVLQLHRPLLLCIIWVGTPPSPGACVCPSLVIPEKGTSIKEPGVLLLMQPMCTPRALSVPGCVYCDRSTLHKGLQEVLGMG